MTITIATPEILAAILSHKVGCDTEELKKDTTGFIHRQSGVDLSNSKVHIVQNDESLMHIALPYYETVGDQTAMGVSDNALYASSGVSTLVLQATRFAANAIEESGDATALAMIKQLESYFLIGEVPATGILAEDFGG